MIKFLDLQQVTAAHAEEIRQAVCRVVDSGWYVHGRECRQFEQRYADYIGTAHAVGCANGLDALWLMLRAYKELGVLSDGDEVLVPANTFIATILAITENNLRPVLVEPSWQTLQIDDRLVEQAITARTRALMIVHLYGQCAYTDALAAICRRHGLLLLEDNAQAHGCRFGSRRTGSLGHAAAHSFYPGKIIGALGDAGAVTTSDDRLAEVVRALGNYGFSRKYVSEHRGRNSRLDEIQAAVLNVKLSHVDEDIERRKQVAERYREGIRHPLVTIPAPTHRDSHVYHLFPVLSPRRDALAAHLSERGIETLVHYPIPPHKQACYAEWNGLSLPVTEQIHREELSLPMSPCLTDEEVEQVIAAVNSF